MKRLVVNADDFGLAPEVNEAVERAHRHGVLSAASLMVAAPVASDAVARARRLPTLRVGLHLVLVEGDAITPAADIPALVDAAGRLRTDRVSYGSAVAFSPSVRRQIQREIRAQFEAFRATGLPLDHVNTHQHYHLHPWLTNEILAIGGDYGMTALRVPAEPRALLANVEPTWPSMLSGIIAPLAALMRARAQAAGITVADRVFGLAWSGAMTEDRVAGLIARLPEGQSEIYLHPATAGGFRDAVPDYRYEEELAALLSPKARDALRISGAALGGYADFVQSNKRNRASSRRVLV